MEYYAADDHHNGCDASYAFSHEAKVCQQQTEFKTQDAGDVAARSVSDLTRIGSKGGSQWCSHELQQFKVVNILRWHVL